jgi:hypothetical protein
MDLIYVYEEILVYVQVLSVLQRYIYIFFIRLKCMASLPSCFSLLPKICVKFHVFVSHYKIGRYLIHTLKDWKL